MMRNPRLIVLLLLFVLIAAKAQNARVDSLLEESYQSYMYYLFEDAIELANDAADNAIANADSSSWMRAQFYREIAYQVQQGDAYNIDTIKTFRYYFEANQLKEQEARAYLHLARIYYYFGNVQEEIAQYLAALGLYEEIGDEHGKAAVYSDMSLMYYDQHDYEAAFEHIRKAIAIDKAFGNPKELHRDYNNLAIIFEHTGPIDSAIVIHSKALDYGYQSGDPYSIGISLSNLGNNYAMNEQFDLAKKYLFEALRIRDSIGNHRGLAYTNVRLGYMSLQLNDLDDAQRYADDALHNAEKTSELKIKRMSYRLQMEVASARNDVEKELYYFKKAAVLEDSIRNSDNTKEITKMMMRHEFAQQSFADSAAHFAESLRLKNEYDQEIIRQHNLRNVAMISGVFALLLAFGVYRRSQFVKKANQKLQVEKDRSDELLLNILPHDVAEELKAKGESEARDFDNVTVLFTDFQQFTQTAEKLTAKELVDEINVCFRAFDDIIQTYQIEKIKTIGDAYMAAGGLHVPRTSEPVDVVKAAIDMQAFMLKRKSARSAQSSPAFDMRVGIHTGPVVAGIVGVKKFQYDIWGDTVNTASRMESSGEVGKVNISQATYELLKGDPQFAFESRGKIAAKGKGEMEMYFVMKRY